MAGPGELERHPRVGQEVLDGLEAADRLAELVALLGVRRRQGEHAVGQADEQRRAPGGGPVRQQRHGGLRRHAVGQQRVRRQGPVHGGEIAGRAERGRGGTRCTRRPARRAAASPSRRRGTASSSIAASRAPTTRGVRNVPSADTSVGDTIPAGVTSMPPTAKLTSSRTSAASAAAAVGSGSNAASVGAASAAVSRSGSGRQARPASSSTPDEVDVAQAQPVGGLGHDERRRAQLGQHGPAVLGLRRPVRPRRPARRRAACRRCTRCRGPCARRRAARPARR